MYKCWSRLLKYQYCTLWLQALNISNQCKNHTDLVSEGFFLVSSLSIMCTISWINHFLHCFIFGLSMMYKYYSYFSLHFKRILRITDILTKSANYFTCKCFRCCLVLLETNTILNVSSLISSLIKIKLASKTL